MGGDAHYVDLDRSSVTPFQAAQYAEISRKLNETPVPLNAVNESEEEEQPDSRASDRAMYANQAGVEQSHLSAPADGANANAQSPFLDPQSPAQVHHNLSVRTDRFLGAREDVTPPSPIYSLHSPKNHQRPVSDTPSVPEIKVPERTFSPMSYDFPQTPSARPTPSPFHTNFSIPMQQQPAGQRFSKDLGPNVAESAPAPPVTPIQATAPDLAKREEMTPKPEAQRQRPTSSYTVYDESDAYGGF